MESHPKIKYLETLPGFRLFLIFDNGVIKVYDMQERLKTFAFQALQNLALFHTAHIANGGYGVIWNGDIDLSEYELWKNGISVSRVSELADRAA